MKPGALQPAVEITQPQLGLSCACEPILRALPEWFGIEQSLVQYVRDIATMPTFLARIDGQVVGFLSVNKHFEASAELHVLGVLRPWHRRGIGAAMVRAAQDWLREQGVEFLQVKTLGPSRPCEHYDATRRFYERVGFRPLEEFKTLWNERNPCLVMVKWIGKGRDD